MKTGDYIFCIKSFTVGDYVFNVGEKFLVEKRDNLIIVTDKNDNGGIFPLVKNLNENFETLGEHRKRLINDIENL